jgi:hypothetical protein
MQADIITTAYGPPPFVVQPQGSAQRRASSEKRRLESALSSWQAYCSSKAVIVAWQSFSSAAQQEGPVPQFREHVLLGFPATAISPPHHSAKPRKAAVSCRTGVETWKSDLPLADVAVEFFQGTLAGDSWRRAISFGVQSW